MGVGSSSMTELANNDYLLRLAGKEPISDNDPFWNQLLSFSLPTPLSTPEARQLEDATKPICKSLAGIWTILTLGIGGGGHPEDGIANTPALANQSMLLLLVLANHCGNDKDTRNPYREALISFVNIPETSTEAQIDASFNIKFASLYNAICGQLNNDSTILLLYILLHRNQHFKTFILSRLNIEALILPILQTLYHVADRSSHHIYMALIIILILSEDDAFSKSVHEIILKSVPWYTERALHKISLGGLLILVVIRTIQFNITRMRDKYLHTNCLAALANMSAHFHSLHQYVAQRIISLFELLCKKHSKFLELVTSPDPTVKHLQDYTQDLAILEEVIRMVLEIINSCLTSLLQHNPHLVYALLHKRHLFEQFRTHHTFQDIIQNIDTVITYFNSKMEQCPTRPSEPHEVLEVIEMGARQWPRDRLKKFPELRFKYVEEEQPEEFFIPYVWSLVFQKSRLHWDPNSIQLFVPDVQ
ncbi:dymeclin-like [Branchiostoma lanceolatum]|uniref:dymeclin-like n=1 Tax=Branchiostoma lanceolatum TaxID=7740 RepID=UPI0034520038